jgi:hypothetical protein
VWTYRWIETMGTGGGGYRDIYADFLEEASQLRGLGALADLAPVYRTLATMWSSLASAATPETVPLLAETRGVLAEMDKAFATRGADAADELADLANRLAGLEAKFADWWLEPDEAQALLEAIGHRVLAIHERESVGARMLAQSVA